MRIIKAKPKSVILLLLVVILAIVISQLLGAGSIRSATRILYIGNEGRSHWSGEYHLLSGSMQKTLRPQNGMLTIDVETEEGTLAVTIEDSEGNILFQEENAGTSTQTIETDGKVHIRLNGEKHKGSFLFDGR